MIHSCQRQPPFLLFLQYCHPYSYSHQNHNNHHHHNTFDSLSGVQKQKQEPNPTFHKRQRRIPTTTSATTITTTTTNDRIIIIHFPKLFFVIVTVLVSCIFVVVHNIPFVTATASTTSSTTTTSTISTPPSTTPTRFNRTNRMKSFTKDDNNNSNSGSSSSSSNSDVQVKQQQLQYPSTSPTPPPPPDSVTQLYRKMTRTLNTTTTSRNAILLQPRMTTTHTSFTSLSTATEKSLNTTTNNVTTSNFVRDPIDFYSSLVAGIGSGVISGIACAPLDLIKTRMQIWGDIVTTTSTTASTSKSAVGGSSSSSIRTVWYMLQDILRTDGIKGCFRGLGATLLTVPSFWGVYFPLYDDFKRSWFHHYPRTEPALIHMGSAVLAGAVSDVICNPMFVVRTRLQTEAVHTMMTMQQQQQQQLQNQQRIVVPQQQQRLPSGIIQTIQSLYVEGGYNIFWRGMTANLLGLSHVAIQFPVYEYLKQHLLIKKQTNYQNQNQNNNSTMGQQHNHNNHSSTLDLLIASALSKMIASVITYPHEVIRSRMMDARLVVQSTTAASTATTIAHRLGFVETCLRIYKNERLIGFYAGLPVSLLRVIPNTCVTFITYELFLRYTKQYLLTQQQQQSSNRTE